MCRSRAEGGQRCAGHARAAYEAAEQTYATVLAEHDASLQTEWRVPAKLKDRLYRAEAKRDDARALYASTVEGEQVLGARLSEVKDQLAVGSFEDRRLGSRLYNERIDLASAIAEGQNLREQAARVREAVAVGVMSRDEAIAAVQFPTLQTRAMRKARVPKTNSRDSSGAFDNQTDTRAAVGTAEQRYQAKMSENEVSPIAHITHMEATMAGYARFDARVRHASTPDGEAELRSRLSAMPPGNEFGSKAEVTAAREYADMAEAIAEGVRLGEQRRDLSQMVELGVLSEDHADRRGNYPPSALMQARDQHLQYLASNPRR